MVRCYESDICPVTCLFHFSFFVLSIFFQIDHGQDLEWLSEMRQVSVLFINMVLPKKGHTAPWALQKAFEVIYENVRRLRGKLSLVFRNAVSSSIVEVVTGRIFIPQDAESLLRPSYWDDNSSTTPSSEINNGLLKT